jgi:hypothetical protein
MVVVPIIPALGRLRKKDCKIQQSSETLLREG